MGLRFLLMESNQVIWRVNYNWLKFSLRMKFYFLYWEHAWFDWITAYALHCKLYVWQRVSILLHLPGVPLPLIGMVAYGFVASFGLQLTRKNLPFGMDESNGRLILLGSTTSMAAASAYFLYLLSTKFSGVSCSYCLLSALLSFSLFFITLKVCPFMHFSSVSLLSLFSCCNYL